MLKSPLFIVLSLLGTLSAVGEQTNADLPGSLGVDGGSVATLTLEVTLLSDLGTETRVDSMTVGLAGGGGCLLKPDDEPFHGVELSSLEFALGDGTLNYEFVCSPLFGCVEVAVHLSNIRASLAAPTEATIIESGRAVFVGPWTLRADYSIESVLFSSSGTIDSTETIDFGSTWVAGGGTIFTHEFTLGDIASDVPSGDLPNGTSIALLTRVDLSSASMSGTYTEPPPASCGGGGACNQPRFTPGCDDIACCAQVCEIEPSCCQSSWDDYCVNIAVMTCGRTPENDLCSNARAIGLGRTWFTTHNCATDGPPLITECEQLNQVNAFESDVWFTYTPTVTNGVVVSTCDLVDFDTQLAVYDGCDGSLVACNNNASSCSDGQSRLHFLGIAGETYLFRVGGANARGAGQLDVAWGDLPAVQEAIAVEWSISEGGNGHTYALYALDQNTSFNELLIRTAAFGGYPATLTSAEETAFVAASMPATSVGGPTAFGLYQTGEDEPAGGWRWVTDEPLDWTHWNEGEPNDALSLNEDWGMLYPNGTWNDQRDSFGNVLIEFDQATMLEHVTWSQDDGGSGQSYEAVVLDERVSWSQASAIAQSRGGSLVCLETAAEAQWVYRHLACFTGLWTMSDFNGGPWVGLVNDTNGWRWVSGAPFDWRGWSPGEPNGTGNRGCWYGGNSFFSSYEETFGEGASGALFGSAGYHNVYGFWRLKLVADAFPSTWGTWTAPPIEDELIAFEASFRFSFKNNDGGPGDGFCFFWGDLSDTTADRAIGGEWGINAFYHDQAGLSVGVASYPAGGGNGIDGTWGSTRFAFEPFDFQTVTYEDYAQAGHPNNMPTLRVSWTKGEGVSVTIALPGEAPQEIYHGEGAGYLASAPNSGWSFGFAGRNGAIDQDVLIGDVVIDYEFMPTTGANGGGPANRFDDTFDANQRRSLIIEYPPANFCMGDLTNDGVVDGADLGLLLGQWGACTAAPCSGDLNEDGAVSGGDLGLMLGQWGGCP